jgi:hypothetical protein
MPKFVGLGSITYQAFKVSDLCRLNPWSILVLHSLFLIFHWLVNEFVGLKFVILGFESFMD